MVYLNDEETRMFNGEEGPTVRKAMELLVKVGQACGAERMIDITYAHILSSELDDLRFEATAASLEGVKVRIPTTTNSLSLDLDRAKDMGIPEDVVQDQRDSINRLRDLHRNTGIIPSYTCHPHGLYDLRMGQRVAFTEFNVAPLANSWFGARTNLGGQTETLASAITGKTPECGLQLTQNRWGKIVIKIANDLAPEEFSSADYGALGYWTGQVSLGRIPVYQGLPRGMTARQAEYIGVAQIVSSSAGMFHVVGVTPEAPTLEAALGDRRPEEEFVFGKKELLKVYEELNTAMQKKVDMVCFGCPHSPLDEIVEIAQLLNGRKVAQDVGLWVTTNKPTYILAKRMGFVNMIEGAGGFVASDVCAVTGLLRKSRDGREVKVVANNGLTIVGIISRARKREVGVHFGSIRQCVNAAITGRWEAK